MAEVEEHLGDAGHADAADADKVDGADLVRQFHARCLPRGPQTGPDSRDGRNRRVRAIWEMGPSVQMMTGNWARAISSPLVGEDKGGGSHRTSKTLFRPLLGDGPRDPPPLPALFGAAPQGGGSAPNPHKIDLARLPLCK